MQEQYGDSSSTDYQTTVRSLEDGGRSSALTADLFVNPNVKKDDISAVVSEAMVRPHSRNSDRMIEDVEKHRRRRRHSHGRIYIYIYIYI
jgi:hypothetical protein